MKQALKGAAKRLTFSLLLATMLGGCAIYEPGYPGYSSYDPYGYGYGAPAYSGVPYYVGPPVSLDFWFESRHGGGYRGHHGGHRSGWDGRRR